MNLKSSKKGPLRVIVVGAGERSELYASYALEHPDELSVAAVVDPREERRKLFAGQHCIGEENCFETVSQLLEARNIDADAVINGTMDHLHIPTTLPLIENGYDILLEKPIGVSMDEIRQLQEYAENFNAKILVCHVLRYAPFYAEMKKRLLNGVIGDIMNIHSSEHVSFHHMAAAYVRGKWNSEERCGSSMLMAKCCHDLDLITWFKSGTPIHNVDSRGSLMFFREDKAPAGSGKRCLTDCEIERDCPYSAKKQYIEKDMWAHYVWNEDQTGDEPLMREKKIELLKTSNPFGKCVWRTDNDVVDHQAVMIEFEDGTTATHNMVGGAAKGERFIHIVGTKGEITGYLSEGEFKVRTIDASGDTYSEEIVRVNVDNDMHGGGDLLLVKDFISVVRGEEPSMSTTALNDSVAGHLIGFTADEKRKEKSVKL